jgi:hypothetical protein
MRSYALKVIPLPSWDYHRFPIQSEKEKNRIKLWSIETEIDREMMTTLPSTKNASNLSEFMYEREQEESSDLQQN